MHHTFLYISLPALDNYDVKLPNLLFCVGSKQTTTKISLFLNLNIALRNLTPGEFVYI